MKPDTVKLIKSQHITSIQLVLDGENAACSDFYEKSSAGLLEPDIYKVVEAFIINAILDAFKYESVEFLELVLDEPVWDSKDVIDELPILAQFIPLNIPSYTDKQVLSVEQLRDFLILGLRDLIGYGATDRKGHFIAFWNDGCVHIGHLKEYTLTIPDEFKDMIKMEDVSYHFTKTEDYKPFFK